MAVAAAAMTVSATDYKGNTLTNVGGQKGTTESVVSVDDNGDGTCTVTIKNFVYEYYSQTQYVGNIVLKNVAKTTVGSVTLLSGNERVEIAEGDDATKSWQGPSYSALCQGGVPVVFKAEVRGDNMTAVFNLDTYQAIRRRVKATFGDTRYTIGQLLGSDFETFHTATYETLLKNYTSNEPDGWHSFTSADGSMSSLVRKVVFTDIADETRPGSTGSRCVKVYSNKVMGVGANGTITTGRLMADAMDATSPKNNSTMNPANGETDSNGDPFFAALGNRPDSIAVWVKFKQGTIADKNKDYKYATMSAVLTDGTSYQDPEAEGTTYTNVVAKAQNARIESLDFAWQRVSVPFDYATYAANGAEPKALLVTLSTNAQPGVASTDSSNPDQLYIDDLSLIYNAQLASATIGGTAVDGFSPSKYYYEGLKIDHELTADDVAYTVGAQGATTTVDITRSANEPGKATATVTVTSGDLQTVNAYTFVVEEPKKAEVKEYTDQLVITINGEEQDPQQTTISVTKNDDGTYNFVLNQFSFGDLLIGDVTMNNVPATEDGEYTKFETEQDAAITNGSFIAEALGGKVHITMTAQIKGDKLCALINLPVALSADDVMDVQAVFGDISWTGIHSVKAGNGNTAVFGINGVQLQQMQRGINIVRKADGSTVKVMKR